MQQHDPKTGSSGEENILLRMWHDEHFLLALAAALLFWLGLFFWALPEMDWAWPLTQPVTFLLLILVYPVLEEIVFRGALQGYLLKRLGPRTWGFLTWANVITSVVFSLAHLLYRPPLTALMVFLPSLLFGYFRDRHNSLVSPIFLHVFFNTGYFWLFGAFS